MVSLTSSVTCHSFQTVMVYHRQIADYFNQKGVSVIYLFRRNLLRRLVSLLANAYDKDAKLINGTHMSHVHTREQVRLFLSLSHTHTYVNDTLYIQGKSSIRLSQTKESKLAAKPMCIISEQHHFGSQIKGCNNSAVLTILAHWRGFWY